MYTNRRTAVAALTAAGLLWGTTVPLSRLALAWLPPAWLTFARFGLAAAVLLVAARPRMRAACTPAVLAWGAMGYGGSVVVQNAGIARTSVSHAALLIGAAPVLVAIIAARWQHSVARPVAWAGYAVSLAGVGLVAGGGGGGATVSGDGLVMASLLLSATFTVAQTRLLHGRDPVAVTAVQFLAAAAAVLPVAVTAEGRPAVSGSPGALLATAGLAIGGTLLPFTLFAYGQSRVSAEVAGTFLNLEPLVGAAAGAVIFGDPAGPAQIAGGAAILAGITLGSAPLLTGRRRETRSPPAPAARRAAGGRAAWHDAESGSADDLQFVVELPLESADGGLVALVERPLPDAPGGDEPGPGERLQVRGSGWLGHAQLVSDEDHTDPVVDEVSVALRREVRYGIPEPFEDLQSLGAGQCPEHLGRVDDRRRASHSRHRSGPCSPRPAGLWFPQGQGPRRLCAGRGVTPLR